MGGDGHYFFQPMDRIMIQILQFIRVWIIHVVLGLPIGYPHHASKELFLNGAAHLLICEECQFMLFNDDWCGVPHIFVEDVLTF